MSRLYPRSARPPALIADKLFVQAVFEPLIHQIQNEIVDSKRLCHVICDARIFRSGIGGDSGNVVRMVLPRPQEKWNHDNALRPASDAAPNAVAIDGSANSMWAGSTIEYRWANRSPNNTATSSSMRLLASRRKPWSTMTMPMCVHLPFVFPWCIRSLSFPLRECDIE